MKYVENTACPLGVQDWCFDTSLSMSDWAAWATFVAALLAAIAAASAVYASFRVSRVQLEIAKRTREADRLESRIRSLSVCRELVNQAMGALLVVVARLSPVVDRDIGIRVSEARQELSDCLKGPIEVDAIVHVRSAKRAAAALEQVVAQFVMPLQSSAQELVDGLANQIRDALHAIDALLEHAGVVEHHPRAS